MIFIFIESYDHRDAQLAKRMTCDDWIASVKTMQPLINTKVLTTLYHIAGIFGGGKVS